MNSASPTAHVSICRATSCMMFGYSVINRLWMQALNGDAQICEIWASPMIGQMALKGWHKKSLLNEAQAQWFLVPRASNTDSCVEHGRLEMPKTFPGSAEMHGGVGMCISLCSQNFISYYGDIVFSQGDRCPQWLVVPWGLPCDMQPWGLQSPVEHLLESWDRQRRHFG